MSVQSEIDRIAQNLANTYSVLEGAGAEMPQTRNSNNLPDTAASIKAVLYAEQNLTEEQKAQARKNIGLSGGGNIECDIGTVTVGGQINENYGNFVVKTDTGLGATEHYIPLRIGETYTVSTEKVGFNLYFYGANKEFIEALYNPQATKKDTVTFTNTAYHYVRIGSWYNSSMTQELFDTISLVMVVGNTTTEEIENRIKEVNKKVSGWIDCLGTVEIDTKAKTLTFGASAHITYGGERYNVANTVHNISTFMNGSFLFFNPTTKTLSSAYSDGFVYLGALWNPQCNADLHITRGKFVVDGMPVSYTGRFYNKKVNCLGDSMTYGTGTTKAYHQWFRQLCGFSTVVNYGVGGSCIAPKVDTVPTWEEGIESFCERYSAMDNDADTVVVLGGVNDWVTGRTLGALTDTGTDTFYGAMKSLCEGLIAKYPTSNIYMFSSPQNDYVSRPADSISGTAWAGNTEGYNRKGRKIQDYANAMKEVCAVYGIPFYSLTDNLFWGLSGVLGDNNGTSGVYGSDALHPNAEGHKKIALRMAGFMNGN